MSNPLSNELASLLFSQKANQLGHDAIGARGRKATNGLLIISTLLSGLAGVGGLADFIGKTGVSILAIVAALSTTGVILAFTTLTPSDHLQIAGEYEQLYLRTLRVDETTAKGKLAADALWESFERVVEKARASGVALTLDQVAKYEEKARMALRSEVGSDNAEKAKLVSEQRNQGTVRIDRPV